MAHTQIKQEYAHPEVLIDTQWIEDHRWHPRYFDRASVPEEYQTDDRWQSDVHGAEFLDDMFNQLSSARVPYEKVEYGMSLTKWLLDHEPDELSGLAEFLNQALTAGRDGP